MGFTEETRTRTPSQRRCCDGLEALRRLNLAKASTRPQICSPEDGAAVLLPLLSEKDREHCFLLALDTRHRLMDVVTVSIGSADRTFMGAREIYRDALLVGAAAIMLGHNHPSGDTSPSQEDLRVTHRLTRVGKDLGIPLVDHFIIGGDEWVSLAREDAIAAGTTPPLAEAG